jgi:hypothetical protein
MGILELALFHIGLEPNKQSYWGNKPMSTQFSFCKLFTTFVDIVMC